MENAIHLWAPALSRVLHGDTHGGKFDYEKSGEGKVSPCMESNAKISGTVVKREKKKTKKVPQLVLHSLSSFHSPFLSSFLSLTVHSSFSIAFSTVHIFSSPQSYFPSLFPCFTLSSFFFLFLPSVSSLHDFFLLLVPFPPFPPFSFPSFFPSFPYCIFWLSLLSPPCIAFLLSPTSPFLFFSDFSVFPLFTYCVGRVGVEGCVLRREEGVADIIGSINICQKRDCVLLSVCVVDFLIVVYKRVDSPLIFTNLLSGRISFCSFINFFTINLFENVWKYLFSNNLLLQ